ncbi:MAG: S8 family serine peptidase, partial [Actinomycetota bacterium]|nr:S8 family serine peptidase [Actinomycetota bacterium]
RAQRPLVRFLKSIGARLELDDRLTGTLTATVPRTRLVALAARPEVLSVEPAPRPRSHGLYDGTRAVGAPSFWDAGFSGGLGAADRSPVDLAVFTDQSDHDHPAFAGVRFQTQPDQQACTPGACQHGTGVTSIAASRGASGCSKCVAADASEKGIAPGLDSVLDASGTVPPAAWALGQTQRNPATGEIVEGAADPAEVATSSTGSLEAVDDNSTARGIDNLVSAYGLMESNSAGNSGPGERTLSCIAHNVICVGAYRHLGTPTDPSDDAIADFSSRGPTPGGRKKPDLVAIGVTSYADSFWRSAERGLWDAGMSGTSWASPQVGAAAAMLAGSGISDALAQKGILLNSARQGRATPTSAMGTQTGWQPDWGWGALDLAAALAERSNFQTASVKAGSARFFRAATAATGDRATLVWNRRVSGCLTYGCTSTAMTLTNLDLQELDAATGTVRRTSASGIDNVEQVRSPDPAEVVYKVKASSAIDGLAAEPFAIAARRPLTPLVTPRPAVSLSLDRTELRPGETATVTAEIANPSPDLTAESTQITLELPTGLAIAPGSPPATDSLGTLQKAGQAGSAAIRTWRVTGNSEALGDLVARVEAARYGETLSSVEHRTVRIDGTPPTASVNAPAGRTTATQLNLAWSGADAGVGVASFDVEVAVDGGAFSPWLTATRAIAARYSATSGHRYRFRVRAQDRLGNSSPYVASDEITVVHAPTPPPPHPRLRLSEAVVGHRTLRVRGSIDARARGSVRIAFSARAGGRLRRLTRRAQVRGGRFALRLRLPPPMLGARHGLLAVRYAAAGGASAQTLRRQVVISR